MPNAAPIAVDSIHLPWSDIFQIPLTGTDPEGDAFKVYEVAQPEHGSYTIDGMSIIYTPAPTASFETTTDEDTPTTFTVEALMAAFGSEGTGFTFADFEQPENGTLTFNGNYFTYTPNADFNGQDWFVFRSTHGDYSAYGYGFITVTPVNDASVAVDDGFTTYVNLPFDKR